ncbi:MAG: biosynthetic-type acetolactate synthase large subunit [Syntrophomonadaceae bacterium]|nr:biosynthetic-type acetolactate synthase large subunit [Syntrophomonadaceae bacterium]
MSIIKGAEALLMCLEAEGVDTIFGYPGGVALPIYDALFSSKIRHILTRHEQGAAHAADAYARASGKVGVCLATSGPGAANLVTGIATANMDSVPMVAITAQVTTSMLGRDAFQEIDITGVTLPITKHSYLLERAEDIPRVIHEAFHIAKTNRPGPVVVDIPKDVSDQLFEFEGPCWEMDLRGYRVMKGFNSGQVVTAAKMINEAERPLLYVGGGVISADASDEVRQLSHRRQIPVTATLMGKGAFPEHHHLSLGMPGMHGTRYANYAIGECDVLIALGVRFDDRVTGRIAGFAPRAKIIHVDIDAAEIGKNVAVNVPIVGNVKEVVAALLERVEEKQELTEWHETIERWKDEYPLRYGASGEGRIMPQHIIECISELTDGNAIITTEVGQHQMWAAQYYKSKHPRTFLSSSGMGTMGYGFPAAIGAKVARPDLPVIDIAGDGSIQMNIQELGTAVEQKLPVIVCILNNKFLGMVRQWQSLFYGGRYSYTDISSQPDFVKLAEAYGAVGMRVTDSSEVEPALKAALAVTDRPVFIDFVTEREANVYPMVAPGDSIANMFGGDDI